jgi:NADH-quinone oxidoreductase subunit N
LLATLGILMLISANDFIVLYLGCGRTRLAFCAIAAYRPHDLRATEAGLEVFVLGALSSGMLLDGVSLIRGYSGWVAFSAVANAAHDRAIIAVLFGRLLVLVGLAFKISVVPR